MLNLWQVDDSQDGSWGFWKCFIQELSLFFFGLQNDLQLDSRPSQQVHQPCRTAIFKTAWIWQAPSQYRTGSFFCWLVVHLLLVRTFSRAKITPLKGAQTTSWLCERTCCSCLQYQNLGSNFGRNVNAFCLSFLQLHLKFLVVKALGAFTDFHSGANTWPAWVRLVSATQSSHKTIIHNLLYWYEQLLLCSNLKSCISWWVGC